MIDYPTLRDIQKLERKPELAKIPGNFYDECRQFIEEITKKYTETLDPNQRRLAGNTMEIISEISTLRYEKIVKMAARGNPSPNMVGSEKSLYTDLRKTLSDYEEDIKGDGKNDAKSDYSVHYSRQN